MTSRPWVAAPAIFLLALAVRGGVNVALVGTTYRPVGDALDYVTIAGNLVAGRGYAAVCADLSVRPTARRPPLFPLLLAGCTALFGKGYLVPRVLLALVGSATCVLLYFLGRRLFGNREALVVGLAAAVLPGLWINNLALMSETLYVFLLVGFVLLADRAYTGESRWDIRGLGALAGLLALTRPEGLLLWGLLVIWIVMVRPSPHRWAALGAVVLVAAAVISPWVIRNLERFGAFIPNATSMGQVLACANNDRTYNDPEWLGALVLDCVDPRKNSRYRAWLADPGLSEADIDARLRNQGLNYMWNHAGRLPAMAVWRLRRAFDFCSLRLSTISEVAEGRPPPATIAAALTLYPTLLAGMLGGILCRRRFRRLFWLYALIAFYVADIAVTWGSPRFRSPIEPFLLLFAVAFLVKLVRGMGSPPFASPR